MGEPPRPPRLFYSVLPPRGCDRHSRKLKVSGVAELAGGPGAEPDSGPRGAGVTKPVLVTTGSPAPLRPPQPPGICSQLLGCSEKWENWRPSGFHALGDSVKASAAPAYGGVVCAGLQRPPRCSKHTQTPDLPSPGPLPKDKEFWVQLTTTFAAFVSLKTKAKL